MALGIQERLDTLELSRGASISVVSSDGRVLAGKGDPMQLSSIPKDVLERAGRGQAQEGDTEGSENPVLYRLAYFKAMDWYVAAAIPLSSINGPAEMLTRHLFAVAAVLLALSLMLMLVLTMRIIAPLRLLTRRAGEIAREDFSSERGVGFSDDIVEGLPVDRKDEVGQLAGAFAHMVKALDENIRRLVDTLAVRQRLQGELNAAHDIQMGILPPPDGAPKSLGYSAAAFLEPAKEVGGDLYDFFTAPDGRQAVVIGDVSDKGVSAALFMSMTVTLVRYALAEGLSCSEAMLRINERLAENNPSCMFVTLFIGLFDPSTGRLDYASGAHCPPFVVNPDADVPVRKLTETSGPLVGAMQGLDYEACHAVIAPGEYCLLYTDGVSEAMNEKLELFGEERIAATLEHLRGASPDEVLHGVMTEVKKYRGKAPAVGRHHHALFPSCARVIRQSSALSPGGGRAGKIVFRQEGSGVGRASLSFCRTDRAPPSCRTGSCGRADASDLCLRNACSDGLVFWHRQAKVATSFDAKRAGADSGRKSFRVLGAGGDGRRGAAVLPDCEKRIGVFRRR